MVKCECGVSHEGRVIEGWLVTPHMRCPSCGRETVVVRPQVARVNEFGGSRAVSIMEGWHPSEVEEAKRLMPRSQGAIKSDGTVVFRSARQAEEYRREKAEIRLKAERERAAGRPLEWC